jgi:hypothetical protein
VEQALNSDAAVDESVSSYTASHHSLDAESLNISMDFTKLTRTGTALAAGAALFVAVSTGAYATGTFNVSTTITASCSVTDAGPSDLTPTYVPSTDSGTGSATVLNTFCSGTTPTVTFTDSGNSGTNEFVMTSGTSLLFYQISNGPTCSGVAGDGPINEGVAQPLPGGVTAYNICAAVITGGLNTAAAAGSYTDVVTYTIAP